MILRLLFLVFVILPFLIVGIPIQFVITRLNLPGWSVLPRIFHLMAARFIGLEVQMIGQPETGKPTLVVSNHISWTDIFAIGAVANVTFVSRDNIASWPLVGFMSSLQKTIYVKSSRKEAAKSAPTEMARRMADGGAVCLFAEGGPDNGTHVLPFRSGLIAAAQRAMIEAGAKYVSIQPVAIAYTRLQGLPVTRTDRTLIAWIKAKSVMENIGDILTGGTKKVVVAFGEPMPLSESSDRKVITQQVEDEVRRKLVALNRDEPFPAE